MSDSDDELEVLRQAALKSRRIKLQLLEQEKQDREDQRSISPVDLREKLNNSRIIQQVSVEEPYISDEEDYEEISLDDLQSQDVQNNDQDSDNFSYIHDNPGSDIESDGDLSESGVIDISLGDNEPNSLVITVKNTRVEGPSDVSCKLESENELEDYDELVSKSEPEVEKNSDEFSDDSDQRLVLTSDSEEDTGKVVVGIASDDDDDVVDDDYEALSSDEEGKLKEELETEGVELDEEGWDMDGDTVEDTEEMGLDGQEEECAGGEMEIAEGDEEPKQERVESDEEVSVADDGEDKEAREGNVYDEISKESKETHGEENGMDQNVEIAKTDTEKEDQDIVKGKDLKNGSDQEELEDYVDDEDIDGDENKNKETEKNNPIATDKSSETSASKSEQVPNISNENTSSKDSSDLEPNLNTQKPLDIVKEKTKNDDSYLSDESSSSGENTWRFTHTGKSKSQDEDATRSHRRRSRSPGILGYRSRRDNSKSKYRRRSRSRSSSRNRTNLGPWARSRGHRRSRSRSPPQRTAYSRRNNVRRDRNRSVSPDRSRKGQRYSHSRERHGGRRRSTETRPERRTDRSRSPVKESGKQGHSEDEGRSSIQKESKKPINVTKHSLKESDSSTHSLSPDLRTKIAPRKTDSVEDEKVPISVADLRQKLKSKDDETPEEIAVNRENPITSKIRLSRTVIAEEDVPQQQLQKPVEEKKTSPNIVKTSEGLITKSKIMTGKVSVKNVPSGRTVSRIVSSYNHQKQEQTEESVAAKSSRMVVSRIEGKNSVVEMTNDLRESELDQRIQRIKKQNEAILARKKLIEEEMKLFR